MSWKLVALTGFVVVGGAIIVASWKPWSSSGGGKVTSYKTCVQDRKNGGLGPSLAGEVCRALGWKP